MRIKHGLEKVVDGYIVYLMRGISNIIYTGGNTHQTIDKIVSDVIADIDVRLNKPKENDQEGYAVLYIWHMCYLSMFLYRVACILV